MNNHPGSFYISPPSGLHESFHISRSTTFTFPRFTPHIPLPNYDNFSQIYFANHDFPVWHVRPMTRFSFEVLATKIRESSFPVSKTVPSNKGGSCSYSMAFLVSFISWWLHRQVVPDWYPVIASSAVSYSGFPL